MANANEVIINGETILDLRSDTVTPETLQKGYTAHDKSGTKITGTLEAAGGKEEEAVTVALDMASGDQIITPSEGKTLSQVTITRPDDLVSRRVVIGSNIGGVDGNYFAPEIWVLNEEIKVPAKALTFTDLAFFTYATRKIDTNDPFPIQTMLRVAPTGKVGIASRDAAGHVTYIKRPTATSSGFYTDTNGWYGESAYPQIGRIMVFLQPTSAAGAVHNWLRENAVLFGGNTITTRKKSLFELGDVDFAKVLNVTANGTYSIKPNAPYSTFGSAEVTVNVPVPSVQDTKAVTITSNGTVSVTPDAPYDALKKVDVTVDVASGGGSAGFSVTFPSTATNWDSAVQEASLLLSDGTRKPCLAYSNVSGQTIENVVGIHCTGQQNYWVLKMTLSKGAIAQCTPPALDGNYTITTAPNTTRTYYATGTSTFWWPLSDVVISSIEMYNTD